jgi:hypothetical protein
MSKISSTLPGTWSGVAMSDLILPKIMPKYKIMQGRPARSEFRRDGLVARAVQISQSGVLNGREAGQRKGG